MRVLTVMNFAPDADTPQRGRWVVDQVEALREGGIDVDLFTFPPGKNQYVPATRKIRQLIRKDDYDLVHAHYGLAGWCARLAGAKPLIVTFHGTDVRHPTVGRMSRSLTRRIDLVGAVSLALFGPEDGRPGLPLHPGKNAVIPCGADLKRFSPGSKREARQRLGLDPDSPFLFFPADPTRAEKRHDRALAVAEKAGAELKTGGSIAPEEMCDWMNAANGVLVTSDYEGFGLACLESLACDVPVLSTPVGVAPHLLAGLPACLCEEFDPETWSKHAEKLIAEDDPRTPGKGRAASLSAVRMAERVALAYEEILARGATGAMSSASIGNDGGH